MPLGFGEAFFAFQLHSRASLCRILVAVFAEQRGSHLVEQLLDAAAVLDGASELGHHGLGHVETASLSFGTEGQQVIGMFVPAGASWAMGPDAGFTNQGQRTFEGGPELPEFIEQALLG
jgi:hypothetical protein